LVSIVWVRLKKLYCVTLTGIPPHFLNCYYPIISQRKLVSTIFLIIMKLFLKSYLDNKSIREELRNADQKIIL